MDELVANATSGHGENWQHIMAVCDEVDKSSPNIQKFYNAIWPRLKHQDAHIALDAITLLNACVKNCKKNFHLQIASRDFESKFMALLTQWKNEPSIRSELLSTFKGWAEGDFSKDPQLSLIPALYSKLRTQGLYSNETTKIEKQESIDLDPGIAKAIALSLQEEKKKNQSASSSANAPSLYPSALLNRSSQPAGRKVRALYDFIEVQEGELAFKADDIITIIDDSDSCWWKGKTHRGEGLLPSNFVSSNLSGEEDLPIKAETKRTVQFDEQVRVQEIVKEEVEIDESKMDLLLDYLHEADTTDPSRDPPEMNDLVEEVNAMGPLIDAELERIDAKHAKLSQLCLDLQAAMNLYHSLIQLGPSDVPKPMVHPYPSMNGPPPHPAMMQNPHVSLPHQLPQVPHPPQGAVMNGIPPQGPYIQDPAIRHNGGPMGYGVPPGPPPPGYPMAPMTSAPPPHPHSSYHDKPPLL